MTRTLLSRTLMSGSSAIASLMASSRPRRTTPPKEPAMRNATAFGLVLLLVVIVGAAAYQILIATG